MEPVWSFQTVSPRTRANKEKGRSLIIHWQFIALSYANG